MVTDQAVSEDGRDNTSAIVDESDATKASGSSLEMPNDDWDAIRYWICQHQEVIPREIWVQKKCACSGQTGQHFAVREEGGMATIVMVPKQSPSSFLVVLSFPSTPLDGLWMGAAFSPRKHKESSTTPKEKDGKATHPHERQTEAH